MIRILIKGPLFLGIIFSFIATGGILGLFYRKPDRLRAARNRALQFFCRLTLKTLGIHYDRLIKEAPIHDSHLILSNHMSYIDVFVIAAIYPSTFVTSKEIEATPLAGLICKMAGCIFVERRSIRQLYQEIGELSSILDAGLNVVIFPEATSSDGSTILPFKRALLEAAFRTQRNILPLCINLTGINGESPTPQTRDQVCYYGEMQMLPHALNLLKLSRIDVKVTQLGEIALKDFEDSKTLNQEAHKRILEQHKTVCAA